MFQWASIEKMPQQSGSPLSGPHPPRAADLHTSCFKWCPRWQNGKTGRGWVGSQQKSKKKEEALSEEINYAQIKSKGRGGKRVKAVNLVEKRAGQ